MLTRNPSNNLVLLSTYFVILTLWRGSLAREGPPVLGVTLDSFLIGPAPGMKQAA